jgi:hypothetical protein
VTYEAARQYLARVVPWPQDGDEPFFVNLHWMFKSEKYTTPGWSGRATRSVDEAIRTLDWAAKLKDTRDIYICLSGQRRAEEKTSAKGKPYLVAVRSQANVARLKSLWLDLDVKEKGGYPTLVKAAEALGQFLKATSMPRPTMMVKSGGGLHVYWVLSEYMELADWQPLANALANAAKQHGLLCDTGCTVDSARILRVPDTQNFKLDTPRPVEIAGTPLDFDYALSRITQALAPFITIAPPTAPDIPPLPPRKPLEGTSELAAGIEEHTAPVPDLDLAAKNCGFLAEAIATGGQVFGQPLWNLTTLISTFTAGGRADAHRMASGHPGYSVESTDAMFDRKDRERQEKGLGWPACQSIRMAGCTSCDTCPLLAQDKTPLHFGIPAPQPAVVTRKSSWVELPDGYVHDKDMVVHRIVEGDGGLQLSIPVSKYPMFNGQILSDTSELQFTAKLYGRGKDITLPFGATKSNDTLFTAMSDQGLLLNNATAKALDSARNFFVTWIQKLQDVRDRVQETAPFGWIARNGSVEGFSYNSTVWMPGGSRRAVGGDPMLEKVYKPVGSDQVWMDAAKMLTDQERPAVDAILASAFAAPLLRLLGYDGILISCFSQGSGIGKTTALKVAQAVWGDPKSAMQGLDDTSNSVFHKLGQIRNLPVYWDELKGDQQTKKFVDIVFKLSGGIGKGRLGRDITMRERGVWQTIMVSASNESIAAHVAKGTKTTTAGYVRVFEFEVPPRTKGAIDRIVAQHMISRLGDNYGVIGEQYARWLGENHELACAEALAIASKVDKNAKIQDEERLWGCAMTCLIAGARFSNRLGLTSINEQALVKFLFDTLARMRETRIRTEVDIRAPGSLAAIVGEYVSSIRARHLVRTNVIWDHQGKPRGVDNRGTALDRIDEVRAQLAVDDKMLRLQKAAFEKWLQTNEYTPSTIFDEMRGQLGAVFAKRRLCAGVQGLASARVSVIDINYSKIPELDLDDGG